jgi:hypothetical protein
MLRDAYTTKCRPFRNSDVEVDIVWYPALPDAPALGFPSIMVSHFLDFTGAVWPPGGEVPNVPSPINFEPSKPGAIGSHVCGTPEDFAEGGLYLPDDPPVTYRTDGLPSCCGAAAAGRGGLALGGRSVVVVTNPITPGSTCSTATPLAVNTPVAFTVPHGFTGWFRVTVSGATRFKYYLDCPTGFAGFSEFGPSCPPTFSFGFFSGPSGPQCVDTPFATFGPFLWVVIDATFATVTGTLQVSIGTCP